MKSTILHILCEGQTEERFVKEVLAPYFLQFNIYPKAILPSHLQEEKCKRGNVKLCTSKT